MRRSVLLFLCLFCIPFVATAEPRYTLTDLGPALSTGALSDQGRIAGSTIVNQFQAPTVFLSRGPQVLASSGRADGIDDTTVVGYAAGSASAQEAFVFSPQRGLRFLGLLPGGGASAATAVNALGIIGGYAETAERTLVPVLWWGVHHWILPLPHGGDGVVVALSPFGRAAGYADTGDPNGTFHATLWANGQVWDLGTLGGLSSVATGVNDTPLVVGSSETGLGGVAMTWTPHEGMQGLPVLSAAYPSCRANAVNTNDLIVGQCAPLAMGSSRAMVWRERQGTDLNSLITEATWTLHQATGVNRHGQIAGIGRVGSQTRAFLLTPVMENVARR